ncbi:avidin-like [Bombina bombina]|uniref:avidin-like n=1 Tax=Bombina bombina TaxID=8345 RepID=UPI00235B29D2|nr:avidin-like [Bombina bombina]
MKASKQQQVQRCNVSGVWLNELGSVLNLSADGPRLSGTFHSSVESSSGATGEGIIGKVLGVVGQSDQPTFTMSVSWEGGSVSTWAGQCFLRSHHPVLRTVWLLRAEASSEDQNWSATRIGENTFHPKKPHHQDPLPESK